MKFVAILLMLVGSLLGVSAIFHMPKSGTTAAIAPFDDGVVDEDDDRHRPDQPDEAIRFRNLQLQDEMKQIPTDGLLKGKAHLELMKDALMQRAEKTGSMEVASIQPSDWVPVGPGNIGGRIRAIAIDPVNANHIWIGSASGGIWSTTNGGTSWVPADDFMANLAISTLVVNPTNPNELYAGTGESFTSSGLRGLGVFKSTNGGLSWNQVASTNPTIAPPPGCGVIGSAPCPGFWFYINRLAISSDGSAILAATGGGIALSLDGGATWVQRGVTSTMDIDFRPGDSTQAVLGQLARAFFTTNGGQNWTQATFTPPISNGGTGSTNGRVELAYAPNGAPQIVFAAVNNNGGDIYRSTDGGQNFVQVRTGSNFLSKQGDYANIIWVNPQDPNVVVVGGLDLWRSTNAATANPINLTQISQWQCATGSNTNCEGTSAHADHHMIVAAAGFNNTTNKRVYFGDDGGIYRTDDISAVGMTNGWVSLNSQLGITQFYSAVATPDLTLIGGTQDNGNQRNPPDTSYTPPYNPQAWDTPNGAEGDGGFVAADPTDFRYVFAEYTYLTISRSVDGGASFGPIYCNPANIVASTRQCTSSTGIADAANGANFIAPFILDPSDPDRMLAGGLSLWRANDVHSALVPTWSAIKPPISDGATPPSNVPISAIVVARNNPDLIVVGHNGGQIFRTSNGTAASPTWTQIDAGVPDRFVTRLTIDSTKSPNWIYVTLGGFSPDNVYVSKNLGASWTDITGTGATGLPDVPVRSLIISPVNPKNLYVGTEVGLFASEDAGATWQLPQGGPANVSVDEVFYSGRHLLAATFGRGIYTTQNTFPGPNTYTWNSANAGGSWLNSAQWTGGPANTFPGVDNNTNSTADGGISDNVEVGGLSTFVAGLRITMQSFAATGVNNDTGANLALTLGSIRALPSLNKTLNIDNASTQQAFYGYLTLTGGTVNGIANTILANDSAQLVSLNSSAAGMSYVLGNPITNIVQVNGTGQVFIDNITGPSRQLEKTGPGRLTVNGFNDWSGGTVVTAGTLAVASGSSIGSTTAPLTVNGGTFEMAGNNITVSALNGSGGTIVNNGSVSNLTVGNGGGNGSYGGVIADGSSANQVIRFFKTGTGTQILSGSNTYTGDTTVSAGTLLVYNTTGSATGTGTVRITTNTGGTFGGGTLDGSGGIAGQLQVPSGTPADHLSPRSSTGETGILRVGSLSAQGILHIDIGGATVGTMYDQVSAASSASFVGSLYVKFLNGFETSIQATDVFDIIITGTGTVNRFIDNLNSAGRLNVLGTQGSFAVQLVNSNKALRLTDFQVGAVTFSSWAAANNLTGANATATADPDLDGLSNFAEYAFARNPNASDNTALTTPTIVQTGGQNYLAFTFVRPAGASAPSDLTYIYERSTSGPSGSWSSAGLVATSVPGPNNTETVTVRSPSPINTLTKEFLRVRVTSP